MSELDQIIAKNAEARAAEAADTDTANSTAWRVAEPEAAAAADRARRQRIDELKALGVRFDDEDGADE